MNPLLSLVFVLVMSIIAITLVLTIGLPIIDTAMNTERVREAKDALSFLDNYIQDVANEGQGAKRVFQFSSPGDFEIIPKEDSIQFEMESGIELYEYMSRRVVENLVHISGADVDCYTNDNITMENTYLKVIFQKVDEASPLSAITTDTNILMLNEKTYNSYIYPSNTSIIIDNDPTTAHGTGYSELLRSGRGLPSCQTHFYINSSAGISYDVYYILYAGADFLVADVRNIA